MWLLFAFIGPISWAISTHIDKYLVDRYFHDSDTAVLMLFTALVGILALPIMAVVVPGVFAASLPAILVMAASGVMYMGAMLFYLRAIQSEEASVVAPMFQLITIFSFVLAWAFLGETLTVIGGLGAVLIVGGVLSLSFDKNLKLTALKPKLILEMTACTTILALANVLFKFYAVKEDFWVTTFWTFVGEGVFGLAFLCLRRYRTQFIDLLRHSTGPLLGVSAANEVINLGGGLAVRYATMMAPIALVSAVSSTTTLFVFGVGTALTAFAPSYAREDLSRESLLKKAIAAVVVTIGVVLAGGPS